MPDTPSSVPLQASALHSLTLARNFSPAALRLLLRCKELILLGKALALGEWRESRDPVSGAFAEHCQAELKCLELQEALEIVRGRIVRMPAAQRKRYTPEERFRIVTFVRTYSLTYRHAAELFLVDAQTISRWSDESSRTPDATTIGSLLKATPPLRNTADVTRELVTLLDALRVGGSKTIAHLLTRAGAKISRESVRRLRKRHAPRSAPPDEPPAKTSVLRANAPNHVWMSDITTIPSLFRLWAFKLVVVLDVYSRFPLAWRVYRTEPSATDVVTLVAEAADKHGRPRHFVTDQGAQFTANEFKSKLAELGTKQRYGAIGKSGSIAIIERFWRTTKELLSVRLIPPLSQRHLEDRLTVVLDHYTNRRPHQGLGGATPAEKYFGLAQPSPLIEMTAARDGPLPVTVAWSGGNRRLPHLVRSDELAA